MPAKHFLGIDVGTGSARAAVFARRTLLGSATANGLHRTHLTNVSTSIQLLRS
jgi:ribulose kinase